MPATQKQMGAPSLTFLLLPPSDQPEMGLRRWYVIFDLQGQQFLHSLNKHLAISSVRLYALGVGSRAATAEVEGDSEGLAPVLTAFGAVKEVLYHTTCCRIRQMLSYAPGISPSSLHTSAHLPTATL